MRKSTFVVLAVLASMFVWGVASQTAATATGAKGVPPGFGNKVAGCYYGTVYIPAFEIESPIVVTLTADGGYLHKTPVSQFTVTHGAWVRAGTHEIEHVALGFGLDEEGLQQSTITYRGFWEFDEAFQTIEVNYVGASYLPEQDPLDPDEDPVNTWDGYIELQRMTVD